MKRETREILERVIQLQAELDVRKALYDELDMLTMQLQAEGFQHAEIGGFLLDLIDNFERANTCFRPAGVKRFEMKVKAVKAGAR